MNFNSVMLGSSQPQVMAKFYEQVFKKAADMVDGDWHGWQVGSTHFSVGPHSEIQGESKEPARIMMNFETAEVKEEFDRIKQVSGAKVIKEPYDMGGMMWVATFADPDGNYFQLMSPWDQPQQD